MPLGFARFMLVGEVKIMYQTLENTHTAAAVVTSPRRTVPTSILGKPFAVLGADSTGLQTGLHLRHKWNTARYVLFGTGKFTPPVGKFHV